MSFICLFGLDFEDEGAIGQFFSFTDIPFLDLVAERL